MKTSQNAKLNTHRSLFIKEFPSQGRGLKHPGVLQTVKDLPRGPPGFDDILVFEKVQVLEDTGLGGLNLAFEFLTKCSPWARRVIRLSRVGWARTLRPRAAVSRRSGES